MRMNSMDSMSLKAICCLVENKTWNHERAPKQITIDYKCRERFLSTEIFSQLLIVSELTKY